VQTAEGALNEVSNILVRLRELAIQSATARSATADKNTSRRSSTASSTRSTASPSRPSSTASSCSTARPARSPSRSAADVAKESANLTKYQILVQAGLSVVAQANASPQAALSLL
jgi:flagellin